MVIAFALNLAFPPPMAALQSRSSIVTDHQDRWLAGFTVDDGIWRIPADLDHIDPRFIKALITIEDARFDTHSGVDPLAIARAARSWVRAGRAVSGGSTLTMQLIRQLEPRPRRMPYKAIEALRALQIELWLSKDEILSAYLTHVPYGGNIEGVEAAAQIYFGKSAQYLTDGEIALLISLPQAPEARRPDRNPAAAKRARNAIIDKLYKTGNLTSHAASEAKAEAVISARNPLPERAWITAHRLAQSNVTTTSTLDKDLQSRIETFTAERLQSLGAEVNIAVTIVENSTMAVRAHIPSSDRTRPGGWIDMTDRHRSPGSTLKPFIYGLAMDAGLIAPGSTIEDAPTRFGAYRPENFNRRYHGTVSVSDALRHSLNVPAVAVLDRVGGVQLDGSLRAVGIEATRLGGDSEAAGLALALGGAGLSVNDLAVLYAALANDGVARDLRWQEQDEQSVPTALMGVKTAGEITQILRQAPTPDGRLPGWLTDRGADIAYKTGTSYGFRDAWAAGYTDDFTIIVWVGRADGAPRRGQTGRIAAAPILFDIFDHLPRTHRPPAFRRDIEAPTALNDMKKPDGPQILFPPDGAEIYARDLGADARGFTLSVESQKPVTLYVGAQKIDRKVWKPDAPGFYTVRAVDSDGHSSRSHVRIVAP